MDESYYYKVTRDDLINIANEIRAKIGSSESLTFPDEYISKIRAIKPRYQFAAANTDIQAINISRTVITMEQTG